MASPDDPRSTSATLLCRLRDINDQEAWTEFNKRYAPRIRAWCRERKVNEHDTDDLTQTVILEAVKTIRKGFVYDEKRNFSGWLRGVWEHSFHDFLKTRQRPDVAVGGAATDDPLRDARDAVNFLDDLIQAEIVEEAFARLRLRCPGDADIFLAQWRNEWPAAETAAQLRKTPTAVYQACYRARLELATICRELGVVLQPRQGEADD